MYCCEHEKQILTSANVRTRIIGLYSVYMTYPRQSERGLDECTECLLPKQKGTSKSICLMRCIVLPFVAWTYYRRGHGSRPSPRSIRKLAIALSFLRMKGGDIQGNRNEVWDTEERFYSKPKKKRTPPILGSLYCNPLVASIDTPANTKAVVTEPLGRKELTERKKMVNCPKWSSPRPYSLIPTVSREVLVHRVGLQRAWPNSHHWRRDIQVFFA